MTKAEYCRQWRLNAKLRGICVQCGRRPSLPGIVRCSPCKISDRDTTRKRNRKKLVKSLGAKIGWLKRKHPFLKEV